MQQFTPSPTSWPSPIMQYISSVEINKSFTRQQSFRTHQLIWTIFRASNYSLFSSMLLSTVVNEVRDSLSATAVQECSLHLRRYRVQVYKFASMYFVRESKSIRSWLGSKSFRSSPLKARDLHNASFNAWSTQGYLLLSSYLHASNKGPNWTWYVFTIVTSSGVGDLGVKPLAAVQPGLVAGNEFTTRWTGHTLNGVWDGIA